MKAIRVSVPKNKVGKRVTKIEPLPRQVEEKAYQQMGNDWDELENVAIRAQGKPDFND